MKNKIIIRVEGGIVQNVFSNNDEVEVVVFDFDEESEDCPSEEDFRNQIKGLEEVKIQTISSEQ